MEKGVAFCARRSVAVRMKEKESVGALTGASLRIAPGTHEKLKAYRKTPDCIKRFGDRYGKPPSLYALVSTLLEDTLKDLKRG